MEKDKLLELVRDMAKSGEITKKELINAFDIGESKLIGKLKGLDPAKILYYIGGGVIILGISLLIGQNWDQMNTASRLTATLGASIAAFIMGYILTKRNYEVIGQTFFFISSGAAPFGMYVLTDSLGFSPDLFSTQTITFIVLTAFQLISFYYLRKAVFLVFGIYFSTLVIFSFILTIVGENPMIDVFLNYAYLSCGLSGMFLAYHLDRTKFSFLAGPLYMISSFTFIVAGFALTSTPPPNNNRFWEIIFPFITIGVAMLSIKTKSKSLLVFGSMGLMIHILRVTNEYFADTLSWPLAVVLSGLFLMLNGYLILTVNRKYLT